MKKILVVGSLVSLTIFLLSALVWAGRYSNSQASVGRHQYSHSGYHIRIPSSQGSTGHNFVGQRNPVPKTIPGTGSARYRWKPPYSYYPHRYSPDDRGYCGVPYLRYHRPYRGPWVPGLWGIYWTPYGWKKIWIPGYWGWWWYDDP